ncbi:hypothetical protein EDB89DRAFT_1974998, partial [Lactarius sanguifluus]
KSKNFQSLTPFPAVLVRLLLSSPQASGQNSHPRTGYCPLLLSRTKHHHSRHNDRHFLLPARHREQALVGHLTLLSPRSASGPDRTATWQYRPRVGNYPPCMCGSSVFGDATFVASPTADELLAAVSMLAPPQLQENDDLPSSGSAVTDALQAFISGEYLQDFGGSIPSPAAGDPAPPVSNQVSDSFARILVLCDLRPPMVV